MKLPLSMVGIATLTLAGCATIVGGSRYNASIHVPDHPKAKISYERVYLGMGQTFFRVKRSKANSFSVLVEEEGCEAQTFNFTRRSFRGWALAGTIVTWTGAYSGILIPWGVALDFSTGALWKPDVQEKGVLKINYKNYFYILEYKGCHD